VCGGGGGGCMCACVAEAGVGVCGEGGCVCIYVCVYVWRRRGGVCVYVWVHTRHGQHHTGVQARREGAAEDGTELLVQSPDAQLLKVKSRVKQTRRSPTTHNHDTVQQFIADARNNLETECTVMDCL
jgi:hypothetical protein